MRFHPAIENLKFKNRILISEFLRSFYHLCISGKIINIDMTLNALGGALF